MMFWMLLGGLGLLLMLSVIGVYWYGHTTQQSIIMGRHSEWAYVRFYPNPGLMLPLTKNRQMVWNPFDGLFTRQRGTRTRPQVK